MHTAALNFKLIKKIKDERFDEDQIHLYYLLIHMGTRDLQVGVINSEDDRMLLLEDYVFPSLNSHQDLLRILESLFDSHAFLKAAFWHQIKICIKHNKFVQVPEVLFLEEASYDYLKYNAAVDPDEEDIVYITNPRSKAVTIFSIQKDLKNWLDSLYPNNPPVYLHQSASLIEGVTQFALNRKEQFLYIYVDRFKLHIISCSKGKLLYYNQFVIKQFSDYIKFIMLVIKSLNFNQRTSQVMLWGYIGKTSPHYHEFYKYVNNVVFGHRPSFISYGYMFDEIQDHHFFDLYSMHLLGSKKK
ncbi:DUF3822 family protein [Chryseosolibacter indicus]|uniref:DUF3822 family protein n=1 Tax=Chryseosolibacter indicus TaxID=2782351 RepID=A0ABS5VLX8_9BACT|nr:DUF3822 family protein [Chryseosolibacter indicus]MBT1702462.1 DUF3822 family protein [Chryseosolibacter indicus]